VGRCVGANGRRSGASAAPGMRAYGAFVRGEFGSAIALAHSARLAEEAQGLVPSGLAERVLANVLSTTGQIESGMVEMARIVEVAEASGHDSRLAHGYYMHSVAASSTGDFDEAHRLIARARAAARRTGSPTDLASAFVAEGFAAPDDTVALDAFAAADRLACSAGNRWMSAFARTEASGLQVRQGRLSDACAGLVETVDTWYRAGEWAQQWHTMSRCLIALDRIGQPELAAQVSGAFDEHLTMGGPPGWSLASCCHRNLLWGPMLQRSVEPKQSPGAWALSPFAIAAPQKVANQAAMVSLGRPGAGERPLADHGFLEIERVSIPCAWEFADPAMFVRALASTGPGFEAMENAGRSAFVEFALEQARQRIREGLPLRAVIDIVGYLAVKPID
jgi:hypothetical protein